jgi:hypothetical protein
MNARERILAALKGAKPDLEPLVKRHTDHNIYLAYLEE